MKKKRKKRKEEKKHFSPAVIRAPSLLHAARRAVMWHNAAQTVGERGADRTVCSRFRDLCKNSPCKNERPYHWRGIKRRGDERQMQPTLKWKRGQKGKKKKSQHMWARGSRWRGRNPKVYPCDFYRFVKPGGGRWTHSSET